MVVTRFAPSPTGYLHVGGGRTALFNWLWARRTGGVFVLRIEDTDFKRNTPTATKQVIDDLRWLGIDWDEGPEVGGPNGPYLQSQRKDIYDKYVKKLLDEQKAYYCFDTTEELEELRSQKKGFIYSRPKDFPDAKDTEKARARGQSVTVRFAMPQNETIVVNDIVRGEVAFDTAQIGDFIIQKSDGMPTYNFACVVDDYLMKITHVIRGQEHLMNTPAQQALWQALFPAAPLPKYVHMSVTVSDSGGKLSKRERPKALRDAIKMRGGIELDKLADSGGITREELEDFIGGKSTPDMPNIDLMAQHLHVPLPEINIVDFFKSGYLPETMVNFLSLLGWNPGDQREIMPLDELIKSFDLGRLTKSNSLFDRKKLLAFNTEHIRMAPKEKLLQHFKDYLKTAKSLIPADDDKKLARILEICAGARTLAEIERKAGFLFLPNDKIKYDQKAVEKVLLKDGGRAILHVLREKLAVLEPFNKESIENMLRSLAAEKQVGLGEIAQPLRVAICGSTISPPIFDSVEILGRGSTLCRIDNAVKIVETETHVQ
ncbi:MAG: glutamate--tRNA ligase [Sedimentisphaerales bacterium]|nr:glutamate--tRNA ligase [Sedimentisphaerales bacterium]